MPPAIVTPTKTARRDDADDEHAERRTRRPRRLRRAAKPATEPQANALLLDTNAASTYNPYAYPASDFGDPSLAIDGDVTTGWTAQVDPAARRRWPRAC